MVRSRNLLPPTVLALRDPPFPVAFLARRRIYPAVGFGRLFHGLMSGAVAGLTLFLNRSSILHRSLRCIGGGPTDQSFFELAASLANRSPLSRSRFLRSAICSFSCSVNGLSDGRNVLLASFSRLLMTRPFESGPSVYADALILLPASPYCLHDDVETEAARAGKDQGRTSRDAGEGRPQHAASRRT